MAPIEFHRYIDARGDTIIYKFDPAIAHAPDPQWPNDSAVTVYHHYRINKHITVNYYSDLLPLDLAMERSRTDKPLSQPTIGMVMFKDVEDVGRNGAPKTAVQYIWKGWGHGEGYRRGWMKLSVSEPRVNHLEVKQPLMWSF
ncbi:hypothetical protein OPT61_g10734 [Boeremia exigua]|uniref:Uncharacterized protein n=1 Tax=Boeremia exigua TaxID=749465 RepID=A0ACC2HN40_9PLEO|nr:hypothetical protein OPT61_g10734 [Boeremia exigua]